MPERIDGHIERVTFHNPDNGFAVLKVKVRGRRDPVTVVGRVNSANAGEALEATGQWHIDRQHGPQFKAEDIRTAPPTSAEGIQRYLASGAIRSVGPQLATRIVGIYGERTMDVLDTTPDFLLHVHGIGPKRLKRIRQSWEEQREVRRIMLFLGEHGIGSGRAVQIYRRFGQDSIQQIQANPYQLADEIRGVGFKTADQLAERLGVDPQSPFRAAAAVRYALLEMMGQGHCGYPTEDLMRQTCELVTIDREVVERAVESAVGEGNLIQESLGSANWLYLAGLHRAEVGVAQAVRRLVAESEPPLPNINVEAALVWVQQRMGVQLAERQQDAIRVAVAENLLVITGGPGVGKTTLVRAILEIFEAKGAACVLTAPTGRAAKRLAETTGRTAKTLHRLLEVDPKTNQFKRNEKSPLRGDLFIVDETSMVDVSLAHQFLRALPKNACLILVGDVDQLPSVGPGSVLADLIHSQTVPVVRLTQIFRQSHHSQIIEAAHAIHAGQLPETGAAGPDSEFFFIEAEQPEDIQRLLLRVVAERIPKRFGLDPLQDIQVLTPMNRSQLGARQLNVLLQEQLNPAGEKAEIDRYGWTFREGDRVLQTVNNYERDVYNGDLGVIRKINRVEQELVVTTEGRDVAYEFSDLDELAAAYVMTVHKSQGSEYPCVVIPLHTQHYMMLQRNLLYTAVTRGKRLVVLIGSRRALQLAVGRIDSRHRYTRLKERLSAP